MNTIKVIGYKRNLVAESDKLYVESTGLQKNYFVIIDNGVGKKDTKRFEMYSCDQIGAEPKEKIEDKNWCLITEKGQNIASFFNLLSNDAQIDFVMLKQELENRYQSEETIGVYYADCETGMIESEIPEEEKEDMDIIAFLPDGSDFGRCTNSAVLVATHYPEIADVYGFLQENNPEATHETIETVGGHDFCVIGKRLIVDLWISHYTGDEKKTIYDLQDRNDLPKIKELYGDPRKWSIMVDNSFIEPNNPNYPSEKIMTLPKSEMPLEINNDFQNSI